MELRLSPATHQLCDHPGLHEPLPQTPKQKDRDHLEIVGLWFSPLYPRQMYNPGRCSPRLAWCCWAVEVLLRTIPAPLLCELASVPQLALSEGNDSSGGRKASIRQTQTGSGFRQNPLFVLEGIPVSAHSLTGNPLAASGREQDSAVLSFLWARGPLSKQKLERVGWERFLILSNYFSENYFVSGKSINVWSPRLETVAQQYSSCL